MSNRTYTILLSIIGLVCGYVVIRRILSPDSLNLRNALIQGVLVGFGLALVTVRILARIKATNINGWTTIFGAGVPGNGMWMRAACAQIFPGPVNVPQEAMYWWAHVDGTGHTLSGANAYIMHFPPGGLPPNEAFWSLTMADDRNRFVENPIHRYIVSDRSGLAQNPDGSVDVYIQNTAPTGHESNWLPAPAGVFNIWLRVYMPGAAILNGAYTVPPIVKLQG